MRRLDRRERAALWYRVALLSAVTVIAAAGLSVGGMSGAFVWIVGFLLLWAATRLANRVFGGFLLGDDSEPENGGWDPDSE